MQAIQLTELGKPEVMRLRDVELPPLAAEEARVRIAMSGVNYIDVYHRTGTYPEKLPLPFTLGQEAAGVVEAVGENVNAVSVGDRVAFCNVIGTYAEAINVPADRLIQLPTNISFEQAAAFPLQGMTAHYLLHDYARIKPGKTVLIHAAAGGVGSLVVQWAKHLGAQVIGTVSSRAKAEVVMEAGADAALLYMEQNFAHEVRRLTSGRGADLVLDGVGAATFEQSLEATGTGGTTVFYGWPSGAPAPIQPLSLVGPWSRVAGGNLVAATASRDKLQERAGAVLDGLSSGWLKLSINNAFPLREAASAHQLLESRRSIGKLVLTV